LLLGAFQAAKGLLMPWLLLNQHPEAIAHASRDKQVLKRKPVLQVI
jgi:hypothetical protein